MREDRVFFKLHQAAARSFFSCSSSFCFGGPETAAQHVESFKQFHGLQPGLRSFGSAGKVAFAAVRSLALAPLAGGVLEI